MEGEVVLLSLWVVTLPLLDVLVDWLVVPVLLLWATANALAAAKTNKMPGIRVIRISCYQYLLLEGCGNCSCISTPPPRCSRTTRRRTLNTSPRVKSRRS